MKIAQVAPLTESVPPKLYGGTERIVSYLTEELVALGHEVTLYASGDSETRAELRAGCARALRFDEACRAPLAYEIMMLERLAQDAAAFDIVHFHVDCLHLPLFRRLNTPFLTTLHGRLDIPELAPLYAEFSEAPLVSISRTQRRPLDWASWAATVPHGIPADLLAEGIGAGGYLAFLGRICPEKRPDLAIRIALESGRKLRIAAKVDKVDREYFERDIRPLLGAPGIEYIGEIDDRRKSDFLGQAAALLFPIDWPEPFGLVMIEAFACGTPVIGFERGSVPEIVEDGVTGFVVDGPADAVAAVRSVRALDRARIRREFDRRFTSRRMAEDYLALYRSLAGAAQPSLAPA
ncbi:MAG TPA: glycosyltransferase family 4 protein [Stellaceae bacterium]|nr:glycosyltransferase family 4 protein [Stellaceae bacterium]